MEKPEHIHPDQDPLLSRAVLEMLTVANDFCLSMEKVEEYNYRDLLRYLNRILPLIYIKASLLPVVDPSDDEAIEHYVTEEQWEDLFNELRIQFGEHDLYHFIDQHERSHTDPVRGSLAENIADLYQDLKDFVLLYQNPLVTFRENAVRECRYLFETRYGYRIVNAHQAIHYLIYESDDTSRPID